MKIHKIREKKEKWRSVQVMLSLLFLFVSADVAMAQEESPESDFVMNGNTLELYVGEGGDVVIPSEIGGKTVEKIEELAFLMAPITTLVVPGSVERIEGWAFYDCNQLTSVTLEYGVETVGEVAFYYCESLVELNLPESITELEDEAFAYCTSLVEVELPSSLKTMGYGLFHACSSLESIVIPNSVTSLGDWAFYNCSNLKEVVLSEKISKIDAGTFAKCVSLAEIYLPSSVRTVSDMAFLGCSHLKQVFFGATTTNIGDFVFADTDSIISLEEVEEEIPSFSVVLWAYAGSKVADYAAENGQLFLERPVTREVEIYEDVSGEDWFLAGVTYVSYFDIITSEDGYFYPSESASRSVTAGAFAAASKEEISDLEGVPFEDVVYEDLGSVAWCLKTGVMSGYSETEFGASDPLTREQFATILASFAKYQERFQQVDALSLEGFTDQEEISDYAIGSMAWAVANGLLVGFEGELNPKRAVTRAEVAVVLLAYENLIV